MHFLTYGQTDRGLQRTHNEDMFLVDDVLRVYAVADGLGGLPMGARASNLAISSLEQYLGQVSSAEPDWSDMFNFINRRVYREGTQVAKGIGIGTTLTVMKLLDQEIAIGHVGDSALFLFRGDTWSQLTTDHTMEQEIRSQLAPGENVYIPEYFTHTLTRCIGQKTDLEVDTHRHAIQPGDRILLCSDGVTKTMTPAELHAFIQDSDHPELFVQDIIRIGNERGGPDNITAVAIYVV